MNKTAKEMFEELGYLSDKSEQGIIWRRDKYRTIHFYNASKFHEPFIEFGNLSKCPYYTRIREDELQAINKQIEELGWDKGEENE